MSARKSLRRLLSVAAVSAFAVALMLGSASSAQAATSMSCVFMGAAGPITPAPEGIVSDLDIGGPGQGNLLDTDSGTYDFNTLGDTAACAGDTNGTRFADLGRIHSSGSYTNSVCGTGIVDGNGADTTVTSSNLLPGAEPNVTSANYSLTFIAGEGPLTITDATLSNGDVGLAGVGPDNIAGWVSILPNDPGPSQANPLELPTACTLDRATGFEVQGFFTVSNDSGGGTNVPPVNAVPPMVSGNPQEGQTLSTSDGLWAPNPSGFAYQWERCGISSGCADIPLATSSTYFLTSADVGSLIRVEVTAFNSAGSGTAWSLPTGPVRGLGGGSNPSDTCKNLGGGAAIGSDVGLGPSGRLMAFVWPASSTKTEVCVRAEAAGAGEGARIEIETAGSGVGPVVDTSQTDLTVCRDPEDRIITDSATGTKIYVRTDQNPVKVCITAAGTSKRIDVGTSGSPVPPQVCWTFDSSPGTRNCRP